MANRGGVREGAGRKSKREKYNEAIESAELQIRDRLPLLIERLFELAEGHTLIQSNKDVAAIVQQLQDTQGDPDALAETIKRIESLYRVSPDFKSLQYLVDRLMGKPTEHKELTGEDGGPIPVQFVEVVLPSEPDDGD
jgi:hypothetical protein